MLHPQRQVLQGEQDELQHGAVAGGLGVGEPGVEQPVASDGDEPGRTSRAPSITRGLAEVRDPQREGGEREEERGEKERERRKQPFMVIPEERGLHNVSGCSGTHRRKEMVRAKVKIGVRVCGHSAGR